MNEPLDDLYLPWLYEQVGVRSVREHNTSRTHWKLLRRLYAIEFIYLVSMDENRAADGLDLRWQWMDEKAVLPSREWLDRGCSFLEMLVALSRRLAFEGDGEPHIWFWHLLDNLDLTKHNDRNFNLREVDEIVATVIWRTYDRNGRGGLFPLQRARQDQRNVELWTQMNAYLLT